MTTKGYLVVMAPPIARDLYDWNAPRSGGRSPLRKLFCTLSPNEKQWQRLVLEGLLKAGADPRPI